MPQERGGKLRSYNNQNIKNHLTLRASKLDTFDIWFWTVLLFLSKLCPKVKNNAIDVKELISNL